MGIYITKADEASLLAVKKKIEKDFREEIHYHELTKMFNLNITKLKVGYKQLYGQTIHNYQEELRIDYACQLMMEDADMNIGDVGYECGYNDRSTFYCAFYRVLVMTPGQWKKLNNNK